MTVWWKNIPFKMKISIIWYQKKKIICYEINPVWALGKGFQPSRTKPNATKRAVTWNLLLTQQFCLTFLFYGCLLAEIRKLTMFCFHYKDQSGRTSHQLLKPALLKESILSYCKLQRDLRQFSLQRGLLFCCFWHLTTQFPVFLFFSNYSLKGVPQPENPDRDQQYPDRPEVN